MPRLVPWVVLFGLLAARTMVDRKRRGAWARDDWLVLIPVAAVHVFLSGLQAVLGDSPDEILIFVFEVVGAFTVGLGILWLLLDLLATPRRIYAYLGAAIVPGLSVARSMGILGADMQEEMAICLLLGIMGGAWLILAMRIAVHWRRKRFTAVGYLWTLALLLILLGPLAFAFVILGIGMIVHDGAGPDDLFLEPLAAGIAFGCCVFAAALPFLIFTFLNDTYLDRFSRFWRLDGEPPGPVEATIPHGKKPKLGRLM